MLDRYMSLAVPHQRPCRTCWNKVSRTQRRRLAYANSFKTSSLRSWTCWAGGYLRMELWSSGYRLKVPLPLYVCSKSCSADVFSREHVHDQCWYVSRLSASAGSALLVVSWCFSAVSVLCGLLHRLSKRTMLQPKQLRSAACFMIQTPNLFSPKEVLVDADLNSRGLFRHGYLRRVEVWRCWFSWLR
jgi:hypothetical protein